MSVSLTCGDRPRRWADLPPAQARESVDSLRIIDVRGHDEYHGDLGHLPGAVLLPLDTLEGSLGLLDPREPVLMVCRSGARSARASQLLASRGFSNVYNLSGGMLAWNGSGLDTCARRHHHNECRRTMKKGGGSC